MDVYCTQTEKETADSEQGPETLTSNTTCYYDLHQGRPDVDEILMEMKQMARHMGESHVAVIGCGPTALMRKLQTACLAHSDSMLLGCSSDDDECVFFDLHTETFEF